jgi:hypothetical protein
MWLKRAFSKPFLYLMETLPYSRIVSGVTDQDLVQSCGICEDQSFEAHRSDHTNDGTVFVDPFTLRNACFFFEDGWKLTTDDIAERGTRKVAKSGEVSGV